MIRCFDVTSTISISFLRISGMKQVGLVLVNHSHPQRLRDENVRCASVKIKHTELPERCVSHSLCLSLTFHHYALM